MHFHPSRGAEGMHPTHYVHVPLVAILLLLLSPHRPSSSNELLEVPSSSSLSSSSKMAALANIVSKEKEAVPVKSTTLPSGEHTVDKLAQHDPDFVDDPDVPPLI